MESPPIHAFSSLVESQTISGALIGRSLHSIIEFMVVGHSKTLRGPEQFSNNPESSRGKFIHTNLDVLSSAVVKR